jgi:hypothetical protein
MIFITDMNLDKLRSIIKEQLKVSLNEYQDKFKMEGLLITNLEIRPQKEILSDIRSITGVTIVSEKELIPYSEQDTRRFKTRLTVKVDGYPFMSKGGFSREKLQDIIRQIVKVQGVITYNVNPDNISGI